MQNRIADYRKKNEWTYEELGRKIGASAQQAYRLEKNQRRLSDHWLDRLAAAFHCTPADLVGGSQRKLAPVTYRIIAKGDAVQYPQSKIRFIEAPPGASEDLEAALVETDDLYPRYERGDVLFFRRTEKFDIDPRARDHILQLQDGRLVLRRMLQIDSRGNAMLNHYTSTEVIQARAKWIAPILWVGRLGMQALIAPGVAQKSA